MKKLQEEPERPKGHEREGKIYEESFQLWHVEGEECPIGTIPIRRTNEEEILRASSIKRFGRKRRKFVRRDSSSSDHEVTFFFTLKFFPSKINLKIYIEN